jgi:hypothetical protein
MGRWGRRMALLGTMAGAVAALMYLRRQRLAASRIDFAGRYGN